MLYLNKTGKYPPARQRERGQSLVEMSLGFIFFFTFLLGVFDIGRAYMTYIALEDSAGEAAMFLSLNPICTTSATTGCTDPNNGIYRAKNASAQTINWDNATVTITYPTVGKTTGNLVQVEISYPFTLLTPIISAIAGKGTLTISANTTQVIMVE